jgi:hypothetical protein
MIRIIEVKSVRHVRLECRRKMTSVEKNVSGELKEKSTWKNIKIDI